MLYSMTGYGEATYEDEEIRVGFRLKTVNNKGLDLNIKLPFDFSYLEPELRSIIKDSCLRGRVDVFSEFEIRNPDLKPPTPLNKARMAQLLELCRELETHFSVKGELDINTLINLPDLTVTQRLGFQLPDAEAHKVRDTFKKALTALLESRKKEGEHLRVDMQQRVKDLAQVTKELEDLTKERSKEMEDFIRKRIEALLNDQQIDELRLRQEILYYSDRLDVSEEITRLHAHQDTTLELIASDKRPIGKELDFMIQEQMREVTTIGNKAKHKWIADKVVALKTGYEKVREQAQNIE